MCGTYLCNFFLILQNPLLSAYYEVSKKPIMFSLTYYGHPIMDVWIHGRPVSF